MGRRIVACMSYIATRGQLPRRVPFDDAPPLPVRLFDAGIAGPVLDSRSGTPLKFTKVFSETRFLPSWQEPDFPPAL
jgi:hypothetical protein